MPILRRTDQKVRFSYVAETRVTTADWNPTRTLSLGQCLRLLYSGPQLLKIKYTSSNLIHLYRVTKRRNILQDQIIKYLYRIKALLNKKTYNGNFASLL